MNENDLEKIQQQEVNFWRDSIDEGPGIRSVAKIIEKATHANILLESLDKVKALNWHSNTKILELGGGQGWASCILKSMHKTANFTVTDISEYAIASISHWEEIFSTKIDNTYHCTSYDTKEDDNSIDFIFTFSAAHHFIKHRRTLTEIKRILVKGGVAAYVFEPVTPPFWYSLAYKRVNRNRPEVREDVLDVSRIAKISNDLGLEFEVVYTPIYQFRRGVFDTLYFMVLNKFAFLQRLFPSTATLVFRK